MISLSEYFFQRSITRIMQGRVNNERLRKKGRAKETSGERAESRARGIVISSFRNTTEAKRERKRYRARKKSIAIKH